MNISYAIKANQVTKTYRIYNKPSDRLKQYLFGRKKRFYKEFTAVSAASFEINKGETVGIIGRNGSGKSTLLQMIAGTLSPSSGEIETKGRIAALLELGSGFNPEFTGRENVFLNAAILGIGRNEIEDRLEDILSFADIGDFIDQPVKTYSSGMYVRLAFAVSIHVNPDILIVDEALAVGDGRFQLKCFEKIQSLKQSGKTILLVSHDLQTVRQICDRVVIFDRGNLVEIGEPNEIVNKYTKILFDKDTVTEWASTKTDSSDEFKGANTNANLTESREFRYGNFEGTIEEVEIIGTEGHIFSLTTMEELAVRVKVSAYRQISNPIFAITFKSVKGVDVYGTNSYFQGYPFDKMEKEEQREIIYKQKVNLMPGDYFISVGFVELVNGEVTPLDRRYDVIELKVLPNKKDRSFGIANLNTEIFINKLEK